MGSGRKGDAKTHKAVPVATTLWKYGWLVVSAITPNNSPRLISRSLGALPSMSGRTCRVN
jgi:hypothetical protein